MNTTTTQKNSGLGSGWRFPRLRELSADADAFADGPFGSNLKTEHYAKSGARVVRLQNIGCGEFLDRDKAFIALDHFHKLRRHGVRAGDVIVAALGDGARPAGRACAIPDEFGVGIVKADCFPVRLPAHVLDAQFLVSFFNSPRALAQVANDMRGATRPRVTLQMLKDTRIPLPPLDEQRRIAARLREQLGAVAQARGALEAQLVAADTLPIAHLRAVFQSRGAQRWPRARLGDLLVPRNDILHPRNNPKGRARFVGLEHIEPNTGHRIGADEVEKSELTGRKAQFFAGDIVYGYLRPYLNKVWIADFDGLCSVDQYVYRVAHELADTHFIAWFMRSEIYLRRAPIGSTPGQLPRIRMEEVAAVEIELPPLAEQRAIAARLDAELSAAHALRAALAARLGEGEKLPAALLRAAFGGAR